MADVITDDCPDVVFVNGGRAFHKACKIVGFFLGTPDYFGLVGQGYPGVRDNEGRHECMGPATDTAADAADTHTDKTVEDLKGAEVISMDMEASRVSAGACELVELEIKDESIIFILDIFSIGVAIESG